MIGFLQEGHSWFDLLAKLKCGSMDSTVTFPETNFDLKERINIPCVTKSLSVYVYIRLHKTFLCSIDNHHAPRQDSHGYQCFAGNVTGFL